MTDGGVAASDIVRSMKREGFLDEEIYDVLTGIGLPGEQVQLIIDRVSVEFSEAKLEPRTTRLGVEVKRVFEEALKEIQHEILTKIDTFSRELMLAKNEVEKLHKIILELCITLPSKTQKMTGRHRSRLRD
jgi:uncharacterized protein (DUF111 family)